MTRMLLSLLFNFIFLQLVSQSHCEPNNSFAEPCIIEVGENIFSFIQEPNDNDYFSFTINEGGFFFFNMISMPSNLNIDFFLSNSQNEIIDALGPNNSDPYVRSLSICEPGTYIIRLRDGGLGTSQGSQFNVDEAYLFVVNFTPFAESDNCECNESVFEACIAELNTSPEVAFIGPNFKNIDGAIPDIDFYELEIDEPGALTAQFVNGTESIDLDISIQNSQGIEIRTGGGGTGESVFVETSICDPGTYYVSVRDGASGSVNDFDVDDFYTFQFVFTPFSEVDMCECEPSLLESTCQISVCDTISGLISARNGPGISFEDEDRYTFELEKNQTVSLAVLDVPQSFNIRVTVRDSDNDLIITEIIETGDVYEFQSNAEGLYTIIVESVLTFAASNSESYSFLVGCNIVNTNEAQGIGKLQIFPNPVSERLFFQGLDALKGKVEYYLYDNNGVLINEIITDNTFIDMSSVPNGVYFLKIVASNFIYSEKITKF